MSFTIKAIDETTGSITVAYDVDNQDQILLGMPIHDANALYAALSDYEAAYHSGLEAVQVSVDPSLQKYIVPDA